MILKEEEEEVVRPTVISCLNPSDRKRKEKKRKRWREREGEKERTRRESY